MKRFSLFALCLVATLAMWAQKKDLSHPAEQAIIEAEFPGGKEECLKYLKKSIKYPPSLGRKKISGNVDARFTIDLDGSVVDVVIMKSGDELLSKEVHRVLVNMPKWEPAKRKKKPISETYRVFVSFSMVENSHGYGELIEIKSLAKVKPVAYEGGVDALETLIGSKLGTDTDFSALFSVGVQSDGHAEVWRIGDGYHYKGHELLDELLSNATGWVPACAEEEAIDGTVLLNISCKGGKIKVEWLAR